MKLEKNFIHLIRPHGRWTLFTLHAYESVHIILLHYRSILYSCMNQYMYVALISSNITTFFLYGIIFLRNIEIGSGMYLLVDDLRFFLSM